MDEGPAYLLLDKHGEPLDIIENLNDAINAAQERAKGGTVYLDAPTEEDFRYIEAADDQELDLAANPRRLPVVGDAGFDGMKALAAAMGRSPDALIDYDEAMSLSLPEAHLRVEAMFPTRKPTKSGFEQLKVYRRPLSMADAFLGQNYKTEKKAPANIKRLLYKHTGFREANVRGLSLLPTTQTYTEPMVKQIMRSAKRHYGIQDFRPVRLNACVRATPECASSCLVFSGRNLADDYNTAKKYALASALVHEPEAFVRLLWEGIHRHRNKMFRENTMPLIRLNVFSDLPWELMTPQLFDDFSDVQFYDYTKVPGRTPPPNYDLTFSFAGTERNVADMDSEIRDRGRRVAVVFAAMLEKGGVEYPKKPIFMRYRKGTKGTLTDEGHPVQRARYDAKLPDEFIGLPVIDGDESDMRPYDPAPSIVGLRWKSPANQGVTLEEADVFIVLVDVVHTGGGYYSCIVSKTPRFDDVDYAEYAADVTD